MFIKRYHMKVTHSRNKFKRDQNRLAALRQAVEEQAMRDYEEAQKKKGGSSKRTYYKEQKLTDIYELAEMMFYNNRSFEEIAEAVNRNTRTIYYWKKKFNWEREKNLPGKGRIHRRKVYRKGPKFQYRRQELQKLYDAAENMFYEYKTYEEIGNAIGRTSRTIQAWKTKFGWKRSKNEKYSVARKLYEEENDWVKRLHYQLDIPMSTLYTWIRRDNWTRKN